MSKVWNAHHIRPTKNQNCPNGRPLVMYSLPALYNTRNYLEETTLGKIDACPEECAFRGDMVCDEELSQLCDIYRLENNWSFTNDLKGLICTEN